MKVSISSSSRSDKDSSTGSVDSVNSSFWFVVLSPLKIYWNGSNGSKWSSSSSSKWDKQAIFKGGSSPAEIEFRLCSLGGAKGLIAIFLISWSEIEPIVLRILVSISSAVRTGWSLAFFIRN